MTALRYVTGSKSPRQLLLVMLLILAAPSPSRATASALAGASSVSPKVLAAFQNVHSRQRQDTPRSFSDSWSRVSLSSAGSNNQADSNSQPPSSLYKRNEVIEPIDVAIIGGGPTGLACALALLRATSSSSHPLPSMAIFESDTFQPKGASIVVSSPGWKALRCIDKETYKDARATSAPMSAVLFKDFSGKSILPRPVNFVMRRMIRPVLRLLRQGLARSNSWHVFRNSLRSGVQRVGSELGYSMDDLLRTNAKLVSVDPASDPNRVLLTFRDGTKVKASVVLACDGSFSTVRKSLDEFEDQSSGASSARRKAALIDERKTVWRGTAPNIASRGIGTFYFAQEEAHIAGATACLFPAGSTVDGSSLSIIAPTSIDGRAADSEDARNRLKTVLAQLNVPIDDEIVKAIDDVDHMLEHKLFSRDFVAHPGLGSGYDRIAYFGDSVHPLRPTGEGVSMALEDAWTIGHMFGASENGIVSAEMFRKYEAERQDRVNAICKAVRDLAESYYDDDEEEADKTNAENENKKEAQTNKVGVNQAMKDYPISLLPL